MHLCNVPCMRTNPAPNFRHIHKWELYIPPLDIDLAEYLGTMVEQSQWVYRKCGDCKTKMRCKTSAVTGYAKACIAYADEEWEPA